MSHKIMDLRENEKERFFLVGLTLPHSRFEFGEQTLQELERLSETAGAEIVGKEHIRLREINSTCFIGKGKAEELAIVGNELGVTGVVFDEDLSPAQTRNLEDIFEKKILDRSALILDIFAQHAHSSEGKLQVELAQLQYLLPRLHGKGKELSRLGGGIGTRGPGETKLETDRRKILNRIGILKNEIKSIEMHRKTQRRQRLKRQIPILSLIGYTNAGKSTLLNALTNAKVLVEDKLFSTLEPTAKKLILPGGKQAILVDTVGFIRKLPHSLIASFRATLEEIKFADILLYILDASSSFYEEEMKASFDVLEILEVSSKPILTILNKTDNVEDPIILSPLLDKMKPSVKISALKQIGLNNLLNTIVTMLNETKSPRHYSIPYNRFDLLAKIQANGDSIQINYLEDRIDITVKMDLRLTGELEREPDLITY